MESYKRHKINWEGIEDTAHSNASALIATILELRRAGLSEDDVMTLVDDAIEDYESNG